MAVRMETSLLMFKISSTLENRISNSSLDKIGFNEDTELSRGFLYIYQKKKRKKTRTEAFKRFVGMEEKVKRDKQTDIEK